MKKVLFVGEHPFAATGNAHMMRSVLSQVDVKKYTIACFASLDVEIQGYDIFRTIPFTVIPALSKNGDIWGEQRLLKTIEANDFDVLAFIGIDIWRYANQFPHIKTLRERKGFRWAAIFPYDLNTIRADWIEWIKCFDNPYVYSKYGENILKPHVPNIKYFRPSLDQHALFKQYPVEDRSQFRKNFFPSIKDNQFIYGFIGHNQFRKDPQKVIKAFEIVKERLPDTSLYLHTELDEGIFNLRQTLKDSRLTTGDILAKKPKINLSPDKMAELFNSFDVLVNCSLQEGLSWTLVEAMLCGVPVIATNTTSQPELVKDVGILVPCESPSSLILPCESGQSWMDAKQCTAEDLAKAMIKMATDKKLYNRCVSAGLAKGKEWIKGVGDINDILEEATKERIIHNTISKDVKEEKKEGVILFAQHSAAGDVLMTTRCLKGLKERHPGMPMTYMTSPKYMDILKGNPYIDHILEWNPKLLSEYKTVYNPHGTRIAPGHWGRNCNSILSDFYWKLLMVDPNDFFIEKKEPPSGIISNLNMIRRPICIVHTTGGDPHFRTYKYMGDVCEGIKDEYMTIQMGGSNDFSAGAQVDLRGKLSYRESAWVMDHASLSVNVDSFISHLAGALGVSQVTLFGSGNAVVTRPNQVKGELICHSPSYIKYCVGLGPCSASIRDCPAPCTGMTPPKAILMSIKEIESHGMVRRNTEHEHSRYSFKHFE